MASSFGERLLAEVREEGLDEVGIVSSILSVFRLFCYI